MWIQISREKLIAYLNASEDAEALSADEYVADLYDAEPPITLNLRVVENGAEVLAAAELLYDEEQDGWYMGERIEDEARLQAALTEAMK